MISTLLIANRGEIARRVIRAGRALGLRTVAVYSDADRDAPHVRDADTAVRLGPAPAGESYLSIPALLAAAEATGADAVHPGYGFLSERAEFARAVTDAGLVFVGPGAGVIERMGRKDAAREVAVAAGVPVVPRGDDALPGAGGAWPGPVLVKAAAGGGGKGMRIVRAPAELPAAMEAARREAAAAFGDDTLLVERYIEHGRHVEVQVLADHHGAVVHLFERDCSTQRRHQKVIEEAPAPTVSEAARKVLLESAVALAREVGYTNAGTVEFLVAADDVFFLEMNTRLQVEHPVTEAVTGLDLVQLQLLIASGEPLGFTQEDVGCAGHAMEARVYAEDAFAGFLPQAGVATHVRWTPRARVDAALESGSVVGTSYDPMLGKIIVHGRTREAARRALVAALDDTAILGVRTNLGFLRSLAASDTFRDDLLDTAWLDDHPGAITPPPPEIAECFAAWVVATGARADDSPFGAGDGWRLGGPGAPVIVELAGQVHRVTAGGVDEHAVRPLAAGDHDDPIRLEIDGVAHEAVVHAGPHAVEVAHLGHTFVFDRPDAFAPAEAAQDGDGTVTAPMPGTVVAVNVAPGDSVATGDVLAVMEAMKMELPLRAPLTGVVTAVGVAAGDQVPLRHPVATVSAEPEGGDADA
ncbi:ATP-binding protein [Jiangella endophytica]|uniref:ATP-binding protein n=1 Tax=Jiangella endophytica TaxID=1623398 RepID=UPI000E35506E|nr:biotin carboxylase N-terminal domain-containing protein [Jiangella endophytica]